ncbi:hypothetical protein BaRGS_00012663 [Batillaria attramentaria]|uniref:Uncharacterized protein n=1 Tax=Batillaria attramentaria TaxID=370345 RepID=A0ABD0L905_9CAEN
MSPHRTVFPSFRPVTTNTRYIITLFASSATIPLPLTSLTAPLTGSSPSVQGRHGPSRYAVQPKATRSQNNNPSHRLRPAVKTLVRSAALPPNTMSVDDGTPVGTHTLTN